MLNDASLIGQAGLIEKLGLKVPMPAVVSCAGPGARRTLIELTRQIERYPQRSATDGSVIGDLRFALKNEPVDLGVIVAALRAMDRRELEQWVRSEPNGIYSRRAWFLFEKFIRKTLDVADAGVVTYAPALDPRLHFVAKGLNSKRHKIIDNLTGVADFCPIIRRTEKLETLISSKINEEARLLIEDCDPEVLARAVSYLLTKETRSTFAIEGETPSGSKTERVVSALRHAGDFDPTDEKTLLKLQNEIVDPRYAAKGFRDFQNFVGETVGGYRDKVHFICPKPDDVRPLMDGWAHAFERLRHSLDPVVCAAVAAFGFVFIHPFEDGNGRIHRYLIHHVLAAEKFSPPGVLFPVSAAIVRDRAGYDAALESFSSKILDFIEWRFENDRTVTVLNETIDLYKFFDCTFIAEFLYEKVIETVRKDLKEEINFVAIFDAAYNSVSELLDMPNRRANLLVRLCLQNGGVLSKSKRQQFPEVTDAELERVQIAIRRILDSSGAYIE